MPITPVVRNRIQLVRFTSAICTVVVLLAASSARATAQGMGGGMGGMGGMGGGRGGRGGPGGGMGRMPSPVDAIKANLEANDPLKFLLDRKKPLDLTKAQKDTLERFRNDMHDAQKPVYKDLEQQVAQMQKERGERGGIGGGMGGGMGPEGGMGGARGGRGGRGRGDEPPDSTGEGRGREGGPGAGPFKLYADKLADIQDSFRDRARAQLTAPQRAKADSMQDAWLAEQRKKDEERRERRRN